MNSSDLVPFALQVTGVVPEAFALSDCFCVYVDMELERYKYVVQVVIGEQRGEGVR